MADNDLKALLQSAESDRAERQELLSQHLQQNPDISARLVSELNGSFNRASGESQSAPSTDSSSDLVEWLMESDPELTLEEAEQLAQTL